MFVVMPKYCLVLILLVNDGLCEPDERHSMEEFIVGGEYAKKNQFPHAAFLTISCDYSWICGSSVLNQQILLTAAHCVDDIDDSCTVAAKAGNPDWTKAAMRDVRRYIMHEYYNPKTVTNDIALVLLQRPFKLGNNIQRVFLKKFEAKPIREAMVAGWGVIDDIFEKTSSKLKYTKQLIREEKECKKIALMQKGMLCAKSAKTDNRPTKGDSGSALITAKGQQIGLVSFRKAKLPNMIIYTHVPFYLPWIRRAAVHLYCGY